jgi:hypothetical protein
VLEGLLPSHCPASYPRKIQKKEASTPKGRALVENKRTLFYDPTMIREWEKTEKQKEKEKQKVREKAKEKETVREKEEEEERRDQHLQHHQDA